MKVKLFSLCLSLLFLPAYAQMLHSPYEIVVKPENAAKIPAAIKTVMQSYPYQFRQEVCILDSCANGKGITFLSFKEKPCKFVCMAPFKQLEFSLLEEDSNTRVVIQLFQDHNGKHLEFTDGPIFKKYLRRIQASIQQEVENPSAQLTTGDPTIHP